MATANKNLSEYDKTKLPDASEYRFGVVVSEWNDKITNGLFTGAQTALLDCGVKPENIIKWDVPGSFELIYGAKKMIETQNLDCVITIGCVIKGETMHFEFVCAPVNKPFVILSFHSETTIPKRYPVAFGKRSFLYSERFLLAVAMIKNLIFF